MREEFGTECHFSEPRSYILAAMKKPPLSARAAKKQATRQALINAAQQRFQRFGYDGTTVDEICADADVSRRSFFRYFADKQSLVFPQRAERLQRFRDLLGPAAPGPDPISKLRHIARLFAEEYGDHRASLVALQQLIESSPDLVARENEIDRDWELAMVEAMRSYLGHRDDSELRASQFAGAAIGVIRATLRYWFEHTGSPDLGALGQAALDGLEHGFMNVGQEGAPPATSNAQPSRRHSQ